MTLSQAERTAAEVKMPFPGGDLVLCKRISARRECSLFFWFGT